MTEVLSLLFGGVLRLVPEVMKIYDKQKERQHEREMFDLQLKADQLRASLENQKIELQGAIQQQLAELQALITATQMQAASAKFERTGNKWIDGFLGVSEVISATVRPVLTYWYCVFAYGAYKLASYVMMRDGGASWQNAVTTLWTQNDYAVMLSIVSFWFVDRSLRKRG